MRGIRLVAIALLIALLGSGPFPVRPLQPAPVIGRSQANPNRLRRLVIRHRPQAWFDIGLA